MEKKLLRKTLAVLLCLFAICFTSTSVKAEGWEEDSWAESVSSNPYRGSWNNCTWSAWQLAQQYTGISLPDFGSAGNWYSNAAAMGYTVSNVPAVNSIVCWSSHVGFVTAISEDGNSVYIVEGGYCGTYHEGWFPAYTSRSHQALYGYIYLY